MDGVKSLLKTEKDAQEIVAKARQYRASKLKAAKADAQAEIEAYKAKKAAELKKFEDEFAGSNEQLEITAETEVKTELSKIKKTAQDKKADVVKLLVNAISSPVPELHQNVVVS
ncbi:H(+)-transporting V1 sector ATPase subunit G [Pichia kluyveri]|uniref:V-type proton ATPase subunit G n=1 Tax=Pichia kluyveri TaxID=36015 RepID=A0AAV5R7G1_PICKL|nr:H(+)-transporting V1 sector ATPase subunit G [Pichia kluyveri]